MDENGTIKSVLDDVILVKIDCEKGEGPEIAKKYNVRGYPTFLMTNAAGKVTDGWIGYPGPEKWTDLVKAGNKDRRTVAEKKKAFEKKPTKELACALATHASVAYDFPGAVKYYKVARTMDPANASVYSEEILTYMYYGSRSEAFTLDEVEAEAKIVVSSDSATAETKVKEIIINELGVDPEKVTGEASFVEDLGADSLDTVELVMAFEEEFGVDIPDEDAEQMRTVGDAISYLKEHMTEG